MTSSSLTIATRYRQREAPSADSLQYSELHSRALKDYEERGDWAASMLSADELVADARSLMGVPVGYDPRVSGLRRLLKELGTYRGDSWQERWIAAGYEADPRAWLGAPGTDEVKSYGIQMALIMDVVRPSYVWLKSNRFKKWKSTLATRDSDGFERFSAAAEGLDGRTFHFNEASIVLAHITCHTGKKLSAVDGEDLLDYYALLKQDGKSFRLPGHHFAWDVLREMGTLNHKADTLRLAQLRGQLTVEEMVDKYDIASPNLRGLFVLYLNARRGALDYSSLNGLAYHLCRVFWKDIEEHHPGINTLHLGDEVAEAWKARLQTKSDGTERRSRFQVLLSVRAMYLDISQWAHLEPERWAHWTAPSPISESDLAGHRKKNKEDRSRSHQRTRERAPEVRRLLAATEQRLALTEAWLRDVEGKEAGVSDKQDGYKHVPQGAQIVHEGRKYYVRGTLSRVLHPVDVDDKMKSQDINLTALNDEAFWAWAAVQVLHQTGLRIEELLELDQFSIQRWRHPDTGEVIPLLHVYPSKSGSERLLVASPELVVALGRIIQRIRNADGTLPLTSRYDSHEKKRLKPAPLLFQRRIGPRFQAISHQHVYSLMDRAIAWAGISDATGQPLKFRPHDLRRIFATEAQTSGVPIHVIASLLGHDSIETTRIYAAVYDEDVISGHRKYIAMRRSQVKSADQKPMTEDEWDEFRQHFVERKLSLGSCGRAWGTSCEHEHACIRCSLLRADPDELPRFYAIRDNLVERVAEARELGHLGDVEGLDISLMWANEKIDGLEAAVHQASAPTFLGLPALKVPPQG